MGQARYVGRVGALALALGVGTALGHPGTAWADPSAASATSSSTGSTSTSPSTPMPVTDKTSRLSAKSRPLTMHKNSVQRSTAETAAPKTASPTVSHDASTTITTVAAPVSSSLTSTSASATPAATTRGPVQVTHPVVPRAPSTPLVPTPTTITASVTLIQTALATVLGQLLGSGTGWPPDSTGLLGFLAFARREFDLLIDQLTDHTTTTTTTSGPPNTLAVAVTGSTPVGSNPSAVGCPRTGPRPMWPTAAVTRCR